MGWQFKERATTRGPGHAHAHVVKNVVKNEQGQRRTKDDLDTSREIKIEIGRGKMRYQKKVNTMF